MTEPLPKALHRFTLITAVATLGLIAIGGLVTSHGAGMAVPDWPNTYGYNLFFFPISQWIGGIFYEHTHRLAASLIGALTCVLALWLHGRSARRLMRWLGVVLAMSGAVLVAARPGRWTDGLVIGVTGALLAGTGLVWPRCNPSAPGLRRLGWLALGTVVLQGVLGGLRVVLFKDQIGVLHALLAQLFFVLVCFIAFSGSPWWVARRQTLAAGLSVPRPLATLVLVGAALILGQLALGAAMRHQHAGLAIPDFPLAYGRWWPAMDVNSVERYNQRRLEVVALNPITALQIALQMAHRLVALTILLTAAATAFLAWRRLGQGHLVTRVAGFWLALVVAQACLGAATIWSNKAADVATAHVVVGAISLVTAVLLSWIARAGVAAAGQVPAVQAAAAKPILGPAMELVPR